MWGPSSRPKWRRLAFCLRSSVCIPMRLAAVCYDTPVVDWFFRASAHLADQNLWFDADGRMQVSCEAELKMARRFKWGLYRRTLRTERIIDLSSPLLHMGNKLNGALCGRPECFDTDGDCVQCSIRCLKSFQHVGQWLSGVMYLAAEM